MATAPSQACPLCANSDVSITSGVDNVPTKLFIRCPRCGDYHIITEAIGELNGRDDLHRLSGLVREMTERARARAGAGDHVPSEHHLQIVNFRDEYLISLFAQCPGEFDVAAKVRKLLTAVARKSRQPGDRVEIHDSNDFTLAYARCVGELVYLSDYAVDRGWLSKQIREQSRSDMRSSTAMMYCLTPKGWEELQTPDRSDSTTAFVAMWFDPSLTSTYTDGIRAAIEEDCRYRAVRVDLEDTNNDDVVDDILTQIRASRFVVADVTGHRRGVYFEAGFAKGLGIPVIWTCREKEFREQRTFDTEHYHHILWTKAAELRKKLANRIKSSIEIGSAARAN